MDMVAPSRPNYLSYQYVDPLGVQAITIAGVARNGLGANEDDRPQTRRHGLPQPLESTPLDLEKQGGLQVDPKVVNTCIPADFLLFLLYVHLHILYAHRRLSVQNGYTTDESFYMYMSVMHAKS